MSGNSAAARLALNLGRQDRACLLEQRFRLRLRQVLHLLANNRRLVDVMAATTGLRRGELLGLKWSDIDFERGGVSVQRTAQRIRGEGIVLGEPKTDAGRRTVRLGQRAKSCGCMPCSTAP